MSRARSLSKLVNPGTFTVDTSNNVGLNSTSPDAKLDVVGIISATAFYGDGSNLDGITSAGLGTAVEAGSLFGGEQIYYTDTVLGIGGTLTVDPPSTTNIAYTQYVDIAVEEGADLIIADGDDLVPDILGLSTEGITPLAGAGGRVRADNFTNKAGTGAPSFPNGAVVTGVITATTGSFSGNVSIAGTLTYEDVTNVDSIGLITARSGIVVTTGISTFKGADFDGGALLKEKVNITAGKLSDNSNINVDNGMAHLFTTTETTTSTPNIISSVGINTQMATGDTMSLTIITTAAAAGYSTCVNIDGIYNDVKWLGGTDPSTGGSSGNDIYSLSIVKTGDSAYTVFGAVNNFA